MKRALLALSLATLTFLGDVHAKPAVPERSLSKPRVVLSDVLPDAPAELAGIDLGPAPAPGSTRLIKREELVEALPKDAPKKLKLPEAVRISRKTQKLGPVDLEQLSSDAIARVTLPRGVTVIGFHPKQSVTVPAGRDSVRIELPKLPRREGKLTTNATLTLLQGESELAKITVAVELKLGPEAAIPDVKKGGKVTLVIRRGLVEIHASASANHDADVGEPIAVTIADSGKVLKGRLSSADPPTVMEEQP